MIDQIGIVYLLHLSAPVAGRAQHYLGWTSQLLPKRIRQHESGQGARFLQVAAERGIKFHLVRVWAGTRNFERRLKNRKEAPKFCPVCNPKALAQMCAGGNQ